MEHINVPANKRKDGDTINIVTLLRCIWVQIYNVEYLTGPDSSRNIKYL